MKEADRSLWVFALVLIVLALIGASWALSWFTFKFSTGPQTPPGGPQDENGTRIERSRLEFLPYRAVGNATQNQTAQDVAVLGHLVATATGLCFLMAVLEVPFQLPFSTRLFTLGASTISFLALVGALVWSFFRFPAEFTSYGVTGVYSTHELPNGYVQTWLEWGWLAAVLACVGLVAIFGFKYQVGATDPTMVEELGKRR